MKPKALIVILFIVICITALAGNLSLPAAAQQTDFTPTPTLERVIPQQDIPGNTILPLLAAAALVVIVLGGIVWRARIES
jgi:hypothetical protein